MIPGLSVSEIDDTLKASSLTSFSDDDEPQLLASLSGSHGPNRHSGPQSEFVPASLRSDAVLTLLHGIS